MPTPFIPPSKSWQEMTRREIISSLIVVTIVGGVSVSIGIWGLVKDLILVPIVFFLFSLLVVSQSYVQAIRELKRRQRK
jgi:hypothetical protein